MKIIAPVLTLFLLGSCGTQGWIVGNIPLTPSDTVTNSVFIEIVDVDSVTHWYYGCFSDHSNWCYRHDTWEDISNETPE